VEGYNQKQEDRLIKLLNYDPRESDIYMPNEIFCDLQGMKFKNAKHVCFAYSYIYFTTWLYRYAKYWDTGIDTAGIKEVLGYKAKNDTLNYIIKKNGLLEQQGYLETTGNYPVTWQLNSGDDLTFSFLSEMSEQEKRTTSHRPNYKIKKPVKHFWRSSKEEKKDEFDGVFYDISNTHLISFDVFLYAMSNNAIGVTGFYLYSYLKHMNDKHPNGYDISFVSLQSETGITGGSLERCLDGLRSFGMLECDVQDYVINDPSGKKANTYRIKKRNAFEKEKKPYAKRLVKGEARHAKI